MNNKKHNAPKKSLGQNFLKDENIAAKIVGALKLTHHDRVIEIGPGYGMLTKLILPKIKYYIGVELDDRLALYLKERFGGNNRFTIIHNDFLKLDLSQITHGRSPVKIVGNIPYHITSPVIFKIIEHRRKFETMILMVQKEVAQRIVAQPHTKEYGILSILSQTFSVPKILFLVSRHVFFPKPKIESAVVQWHFKQGVDYGIEDEKSYMRMIKLIFNQRRKMLRNSLKLFCTKFSESHLNEKLLKSRPQDLSIKELVMLWKVILNNYDIL